MKNFMLLTLFASLLATPLCKAADDERPAKKRRVNVQQICDENSWYKALKKRGINPDAIAHMPKLALVSAKIKAIPANSNFSALKEFHLDENAITDIAALNFPVLKKLYLNQNKIKVFPTHLVAPNLGEMQIEDNEIIAIPFDSNLAALKELRCDGNKITDIPIDLNLPALAKLYLANNEIKAMPASLVNLCHLDELDLEDNKITEITDLDFPVLTWLNLNKNKIAKISAHLKLPSLKQLDLDKNEITDIPADLKLDNLKKLSLCENSIAHIDAEQFLTQFPKLKFLNLNKNPITQENIDELRAAVQKRGRTINITATDIGSAYDAASGLRRGINIKRAQSTYPF